MSSFRSRCYRFIKIDTQDCPGNQETYIDIFCLSNLTGMLTYLNLNVGSNE